MVNSIITIRTGLKWINKCCHYYELLPTVLREVGTMAAYGGAEEEDKQSTSTTFTTEQEHCLLYTSGKCQDLPPRCDKSVIFLILQKFLVNNYF